MEKKAGVRFQGRLRRGGGLLALLVAVSVFSVGMPSTADASSWWDYLSRLTSSGSSGSGSSGSGSDATSGGTTVPEPPPVSVNCSECHGGDNVTRHHSTSYYLQGDCMQCHDGVSTGGDCSGCHSFGLQNVHHTSGQAQNCAQCHSNAGDLSQCLGCHQGQTRNRHHEIASGGVSCTACHTTLDTGAGCQSCHSGSVANRHHEVAANQAISCSSCHTQIVETADSCSSCHAFSQEDNAHHSPVVDPYGLSCQDCHAMRIIGGFLQPAMPTVDECISCHTTVVGTASLGDLHHMTVPAQMGQCASCHQGALPVQDCAGCHSTGSGNVAERHHLLEAAVAGNCTVCHQGAEANKIACASCHANPPHHQRPEAIGGDCAHCHAGIEILGTGCSSCHSAPVAEIHHGAPLQNVGGNCAACHQTSSSPTSCASCHQASDPHHSTSWSQAGDCAHCHTVPEWAKDRPKQAACRECHGERMHDKGGPIQDYGACAACHDTVPFHPAPTRIPGYTGYGAGKKKFNVFWSMYAKKEGPGEKLRPNGEDMKDEGGRKIRAQQLNFNMVQITHNGKVYSVPSFDLPESGGATGNLALNRPATASRQESGYAASRAVDGNDNTYWWAKSTSTHNIRIDLGSSQRISKVTIAWGPYYARDYRVEVSRDGSSWTSVASISSARGGNREHTFSGRDARYVRVRCDRAENSNGYSIREIGIFR